MTDIYCIGELLVDFVPGSEEELDMVGGRENLFSLMDEKKITAVVLTLGSEGSECFFNGKVMKKQGESILQTNGKVRSF